MRVKPKIDLKLDVAFIRRQGSQWIVTVEALLENKSKVRHQFEDFVFEVRYTLPADELQNKTLTLSAEFPHVAAKGSWLEDAEDPDDREDYGALEPGEGDRRTFIVSLPSNATMVPASSELFEEKTKESWEAIKVVAVPKSAKTSMSKNQQIDKLKGHVLIFSEEFRSLILSFEMLSPIAENQHLLKTFSGTKRANGLEIVRWSLMQECVIGITKLAYDPDSQNPTAGRLIETILKLPSQTLDKLKDAFSVPIRAVLASGRPETEADLSAWQQIEKIEVQELRQAFDQYLPELEKEWEWFSQHREAFKELRDKRLAHLDVSLVGQEYKLWEVEGPDWKTVKEAVTRLINIAEILLTILHKKDEGFDQAVEIARQIAADFWEISASKLI